MPNEKDPWFVLERSEALAGLLLTSRTDVEVRSERKKDDGVDFLLALNDGEPLPTRLFVVQVKGTTSSDKNEWLQDVKELFQPKQSTIYIPVCVFVVNVRSNRTLYAWMAEPLVEAKGATLRFLPAGDFHDLNQSAVDDIVVRVKAWYDALPKQLLPRQTKAETDS